MLIFEPVVQTTCQTEYLVIASYNDDGCAPDAIFEAPRNIVIGVSAEQGDKWVS